MGVFGVVVVVLGGGYDVERGLGECCDPIFIPEQIEDFCVEGGFKV